MTPPLNSTSRYTFKKLKTSVSTKMCIKKCTEALFMIAKIKKQPKYSSSDKQKYKLWCIQIMKYYLVTKRNEILTCCNMMILKNIILSRRSCIQEVTYCMTPE